MDLLERSFSPSEVAQATGVKAKTISSWADRGLIVGHKSGGSGKGSHRRHSWFNVMEVACATALMEAGVRAPADAFKAAMHFAHVGSGASGWGEEGATLYRPARQPGLPHHWGDGHSLLIVAGERSIVRPTKPRDGSFWSYLHELGTPEAFTTVNVTMVFQRVTHNFGLDWRVVLDEAYPRGDPGSKGG